MELPERVLNMHLHIIKIPSHVRVESSYKILNIIAYSFDCCATVFIRAKYDKQYV